MTNGSIDYNVSDTTNLNGVLMTDCRRNPVLFNIEVVES